MPTHRRSPAKAELTGQQPSARPRGRPKNESPESIRRRQLEAANKPLLALAPQAAPQPARQVLAAAPRLSAAPTQRLSPTRPQPFMQRPDALAAMAAMPSLGGMGPTTFGQHCTAPQHAPMPTPSAPTSTTPLPRPQGAFEQAVIPAPTSTTTTTAAAAASAAASPIDDQEMGYGLASPSPWTAAGSPSTPAADTTTGGGASDAPATARLPEVESQGMEFGLPELESQGMKFGDDWLARIRANVEAEWEAAARKDSAANFALPVPRDDKMATAMYALRTEHDPFFGYSEEW